MQSALVLNHAKKCADLQCAAQPMRTAPRLRDRAFPTPQKPPVRLPGQGDRSGHSSLRKSHQVGVSLVRQKPKTSEKAVVSGAGMVRHSPLLLSSKARRPRPPPLWVCSCSLSRFLPPPSPYPRLLRDQPSYKARR